MKALFAFAAAKLLSGEPGFHPNQKAIVHLVSVCRSVVIEKTPGFGVGSENATIVTSYCACRVGLLIGAISVEDMNARVAAGDAECVAKATAQ